LFVYLAVLGFRLRALYLLGRCSTSGATPQPFFAFIYFSGRISYFYHGPALHCNTSAWGFPHSWDHRCVPPHLAYWLKWWGLSNFCLGWPWLMILLICASQAAENTQVSHDTWPVCVCVMCLFVCLCIQLGIGPRASGMLGKYSALSHLPDGHNF
jgi:hypothetical protein